MYHRPGTVQHTRYCTAHQVLYYTTGMYHTQGTVQHTMYCTTQQVCTIHKVLYHPPGTTHKVCTLHKVLICTPGTVPNTRYLSIHQVLKHRPGTVHALITAPHNIKRDQVITNYNSDNFILWPQLPWGPPWSQTSEVKSLFRWREAGGWWGGSTVDRMRLGMVAMTGTPASMRGGHRKRNTGDSGLEIKEDIHRIRNTVL